MGPFNFAADPPPCISSQADKTIFPAWERALRREKKCSLRPGNARLQKWLAGLGTAFPCVLTHLTPCPLASFSVLENATE